MSLFSRELFSKEALSDKGNVTVIMWVSQYNLEHHSSGITWGHPEVCLSFRTQLYLTLLLSKLWKRRVFCMRWAESSRLEHVTLVATVSGPLAGEGGVSQLQDLQLSVRGRCFLVLPFTLSSLIHLEVIYRELKIFQRSLVSGGQATGRDFSASYTVAVPIVF